MRRALGKAIKVRLLKNQLRGGDQCKSGMQRRGFLCRQKPSKAPGFLSSALHPSMGEILFGMPSWRPVSMTIHSGPFDLCVA